MSFSTPQSAKSSRSLRRSGSYLSLADMQSCKAGTSASHMSDHVSPYTRPPRHHKERRRSTSRPCNDQITIHIQPSRASPSPKPPQYTMSTAFRTTSPLAPTRSILPPRANFPKSKPEPDLYRVAITTRMRMSSEGQKILHMGPRLALSIYDATKELERIVASQRDMEGDIIMTDAEGLLSSSWVVLDDWDMLDE
ncbi:hypothetical protein NM688_g3055 [Phlebia brevispora]|uniref:Uncharacterized protein n=1 Tax=Phlebia brevispora TaxID=194682 RepID=A0ACC1T716_9APHY|nr:hypothetical protein NM688_g3055 [Phlebia brevispora]